MMKRKNKNNVRWFVIGLFGVLLAAPNATVIRYSVGDTNSVLFNVLRFGLLSALLLPYVLAKRRSITARALKYSILMGLFMAIAVTVYVVAIQKSQASYVSVLTLITPVVFILYSIKFDKQRINMKSFAGITLAAAGAFVVVAVPIIWRQQANFVFYPLATGLSFINVLTFPLAIIASKRAYQDGAPIMAIMGISSIVVFTVSLASLLILNDNVVLNQVPPRVVFGVIYSGFVVAFLSRICNVLSYERLGSVISASLGYLETFLAVLLPIFMLGEKLSIEMVVGGVLILVGVYVVEYHASTHHKHTHILRHH